VCERDERRGESDMRRWRKEPDIRLCRCRNRGTNSKQAVEKFIRICDCVTSKRGSANNAVRLTLVSFYVRFGVIRELV
jgi:hypothetical protein